MNKDPNRPRPVRLNEISKMVDDHLKNSGEKFSALVKKSLVAYLDEDGPKNEIPMKEIVEEFKKYRANLSRVGGNLNQLAFYFNSTGIVHEPALAKVHDELIVEFQELVQFFRDIEQLILDLRGHHGRQNTKIPESPESL